MYRFIVFESGHRVRENRVCPRDSYTDPNSKHSGGHKLSLTGRSRSSLSRGHPHRFGTASCTARTTVCAIAMDFQNLTAYRAGNELWSNVGGRLRNQPQLVAFAFGKTNLDSHELSLTGPPAIEPAVDIFLRRRVLHMPLPSGSQCVFVVPRTVTGNCFRPATDA